MSPAGHRLYGLFPHPRRVRLRDHLRLCPDDVLFPGRQRKHGPAPTEGWLFCESPFILSFFQASESDWGTFGSVANWIPKQVEVNAGLFGEFLTRQSYLTTLFGVFLAVVCCSGLAFLSVTMNPVDMWAPPNSRTIQEKKYFDSHFGYGPPEDDSKTSLFRPFYRVQQIIIYPKKENRAGLIFEKEFLIEVGAFSLSYCNNS